MKNDDKCSHRYKHGVAAYYAGHIFQFCYSFTDEKKEYIEKCLHEPQVVESGSLLQTGWAKQGAAEIYISGPT